MLCLIKLVAFNLKLLHKLGWLKVRGLGWNRGLLLSLALASKLFKFCFSSHDDSLDKDSTNIWCSAVATSYCTICNTLANSQASQADSLNHKPDNDFTTNNTICIRHNLTIFTLGSSQSIELAIALHVFRRRMGSELNTHITKISWFLICKLIRGLSSGLIQTVVSNFAWISGVFA